MINAIEIKNLTFAYKNQMTDRALNGITLDVRKGEFLVILGSSGAGKTTLAYCLNNIIPNMVHGQYEGAVLINGEEVAIHEPSYMAKNIGLVFQDFEHQLFSTNVRLEIAFAPENFAFLREEMEEIIDETLNLIGLKGFDDREPSTLSGGQKQRLAIGSVLAGQPSILCMDEPTTDLDPIGKVEVFSLAKRLSCKNNITLIMIEHETEEALYADRVMIMKDGKIFRLGIAEDVLRDVSAFKTCGIMPLQIADFFLNIKALK